MFVEFNPHKTCFCCNIANISTDENSYNHAQKLKKNYYYKEKTITDEFTNEEIIIKQFFESFSFFEVFQNLNKEEICRQNLTSYRVNWEKNPKSDKILLLKATTLVNLLFEIYPKMMLYYNKKNLFYNYQDDEIYKQILGLFDINALNNYSQSSLKSKINN